MNAAAKIDIVTDFNDTPEHLAQIRGNGHFLDRVIEFAVFNPETGGAA